MKGIRIGQLVLSFLLYAAPSSNAQQPYGHEWINAHQSYYRIPISHTGLYGIAGSELARAGVPVDSIPPRAFQVFRNGKELAIEIGSDSLGTVTSTGQIRFFAKANDGAADSSLYINPASQPHTYYSLYSDTASYFLTWRRDGGYGKRIRILDTGATNTDTLTHHMEESLRLFTSHYAPGNFYPPGSNFDNGLVSSTYDVGEGWTGPEIKDNQWESFSLQTQNVDRERFGQAYAELVIVGRSAGNHKIEVWTGTKLNPGRKLIDFSLLNYNSTRIRVNLQAADLRADGEVTLSITLKGIGASISASAIRWHYPQQLILSPGTAQKTIRLDSLMSLKTLAPQSAGAFSFYDISDPLNLRKIKLKDGRFTVGDIRNVLAVKEAMKITTIKKVHFQDIDSARTNYLLISHPMVRLPMGAREDPVTAYAAYRSSSEGGHYKVLTINFQEVCDRFNYGDPGPLGIKKLIKWLNRNEDLQYVFIIGKSIDPQTARKSKQRGELDMIPNGSWPGSDLALAMEVGDSASSYIPSVPVGRINATSPEQVWNYLQKVRQIESQPPSALWRKRILHLSGGRSPSELSLFRNYVHSYEEKITGSYLAPSITTISKKTDDPVEQFPLDAPLNEGVSLLTLFGHSGVNVTDIDLGYATDSQRNYKNGPFYPAVIVNGCATGSIFYSPSTISSDWTFAPEAGSVLFLAHTFNGISTSLNRYTKSFYEVLADSSFTNEPFGRIQKEAIRRNMAQNPSIADRITAQQMNLHGDPAIRIFPARLPDYTFDSTLFAVSDRSGKHVTSQSDSMLIRIGIVNSGRFRKTDFNLTFKRKRDEQVVFESRFTFPALVHADTIILKIPNNNKNYGTEQWTFSIDSENHIAEENEYNNVFSPYIELPEDGAIPLLPIQDFHTDKRELELIAQVPQKDASVIFEWDVHENFSSATSDLVSATDYIAKKSIMVAGSPPQKLYWRVYLPEDKARPSHTRFVTYSSEAPARQRLPEVIVYADQTNNSEIQEGDIFKRQVRFRDLANISFRDSVTVTTTHSSAGKTIVKTQKINALNPGETRMYDLSLPTLGKVGKNDVKITFNSTRLPEEIYTNNTLAFSYFVRSDHIPPVLNVSIDNRRIPDNDVVSASPLIGVQIRDENLFLIRQDTSGIEVFIQEDCSPCPLQKLSLRDAETIARKPNDFLVQVRTPAPLKPGSYSLLVKARDVSNNMAPIYQIRFRVTDSPIIADAGVSPNPAAQSLRFYLDIEGANVTDPWLITITDMLGREIKKLKIIPHLGRNEIFWEPTDLPGQMLLYHMKLGNWPLSPGAQNGMRGKVVWHP